MSLFVMPVLILGALAVFGAHRVAGRRLAGKTRWYAESAAYCLTAAVVVYAWGLSNTFTMDLDETCELGHGQTTDPAAYTGMSLFPLSRPCNASYDLVPPYVNPAILALLAATVALSALAVHRHRPHKESSKS